MYDGLVAFATEDEINTIITSGFQIPEEPGIFGRGLYFSSNPFTNFYPGETKKLLLCKVAIGRSITQVCVIQGMLLDINFIIFLSKIVKLRVVVSKTGKITA